MGQAETNAARSCPYLLFDGVESSTGRALLTVSSLYWALDWLELVSPHFVGVTDPNMAIALQAFTRDSGVPVSWSSDGEELFSEAVLYAGMAFRSGEHMRLTSAREHGVPVALAVQYADERWSTPSTIIHQALSYDPMRFANHLGSIVRSLT